MSGDRPPPFLVLALPRSRTAWLSRFLTYGDWVCGHEQVRYLRVPGDAVAWLSQPYTGSAETAVARWWRLLRAIRPDVRVLTIRRPVTEVVDSLLRLDLGDGRVPFDRHKLTAIMERCDRALDAVERHMAPLSIPYDELRGEDACRRAFQWCLGIDHDPMWWKALAPVNLQIDFRAMMRQAAAFAPQMAAAGRACLTATSRLRHGNEIRALAEFDDGVVIQREPLGVFWRDAQDLFRQHCRSVGEPEDQYMRKNLGLIEGLESAGRWQFVTARKGGKMLGYLASIIAPSIELNGVTTATQTLFFVTEGEAGKGLAMRLQRASIADLRQRGVGEIYLRAGVRGAGPRLGILYKRLKAEEFGALYKLTLSHDIKPLT